MVEVRAFGVFETKGKHLFRTSAYLQFGSKEESLGSFLLLNPGSASPISMDDFVANPYQLYPIKIDPTMRQIIQLVYKIYGTEQLNGRVTIYNLFSLRNPKNVDAIELFEELVKKGELRPYESVVSIEKLKDHPWICCAWGIHPPNRYRQLGHAKTVWKRALREAGIPQFGMLHENGRDYYHIRPQKVADQEILIEELYKDYQSKVNVKTTKVKPENIIAIKNNNIVPVYLTVVHIFSEYLLILDWAPYEEFKEEPEWVFEFENEQAALIAGQVLKTVFSRDGSVEIANLLRNNEKETRGIQCN